MCIRDRVNRFLTIYLIGTLLAYALFPYFPSEPPRVVFPDLDRPLITTWARSELMDLEGRDDSCRRLPERTRFVGLLCGLGNVFWFLRIKNVWICVAFLRNKRVGRYGIWAVPLCGRRARWVCSEPYTGIAVFDTAQAADVTLENVRV